MTRFYQLTVLFIWCCLTWLNVGIQGAENPYYKSIFQNLDQIKESKKLQLVNYVARIKEKAAIVKNDPIMLKFFRIKNMFFMIKKTRQTPDKLNDMIEKLKTGMREHYLKNYLMFYDIMFVNKDGDVFYTIRKETDYHCNLFKDKKLSNTTLAKQLKACPKEKFIDYQYYAVSGEPSAFLVEPVMDKKKITGWFILQCAIGKINSMFSAEEKLGETGEIFLVNEERQMLTDSRFQGDSSILKIHLSKQNINEKFKEQNGHKIVTDYRGFRVLSSFEVFPILGSKWLLIAKIDEDEIMTKYYIKNRTSLRTSIQTILKKQKICFSTPCKFNAPKIRVDMDEFRKAHHKELLYTLGLSTCTAFIASYPGKFAYMSHISVYDKIYGGASTDLVAHIMKRIKYFDAYKYESRYLQFTVIAKQLETVGVIIDKLVNTGILLSQINVIYNPEDLYGSVYHDYVTGKTEVRWKTKVGKRLNQQVSKQCNIGFIAKNLIIKPSN